MRAPRSAAVVGVVVLAVAGVSGCNAKKVVHTAASGSPAPVNAAPDGPIPVGQGPQTTYTVQAQPAPGSCHYRHTASGEPLPDPSCTPGATSPAVTQATIATTICKPGGYTLGIRPPASVTGREKTANAASYGYTGTMATAEYDHLISLQLGGDPNDPRNLWVEPNDPGYRGSGPNNLKDPVETRLHTAVCKGQVKLADAQQAIASDWTTAEQKLGLTDTTSPADASADGD